MCGVMPLQIPQIIDPSEGDTCARHIGRCKDSPVVPGHRQVFHDCCILITVHKIKFDINENDVPNPLPAAADATGYC